MFILRMAAAIFLLLPVAHLAGQDREDYEHQFTGSFTLAVSLNGKAGEMANLALQDLSLAAGFPLENTRVNYEYEAGYSADSISPGHYIIKVEFISVKALAPYVNGEDVGDALRPASAMVNFYAFSPFGYKAGVIRVPGIPLVSGLPKIEKEVLFPFEEGLVFQPREVEFGFGEEFYDKFRSELSRINQYQSALSLTDAFLLRLDKKYLARYARLHELLILRIECRRISRFLKTDPELTAYLLAHPGKLDPIKDRLRLLDEHQSYLDAMIETRLGGGRVRGLNGSVGSWVLDYTRTIEGYQEKSASLTPHRMGAFSTMARLSLDNADMAEIGRDLETVLQKFPPRIGFLAFSRFFQRSLMDLFEKEYASGNYEATETYLFNAHHVSHLVPGSLQTEINRGNEVLGAEKVYSYLEVSLKAASKNNLGLADEYARRAFEASDCEHCPAGLRDMARRQIYAVQGLLIGTARQMLDKGETEQSMGLLQKARKYCNEGMTVPCPQELFELERQASMHNYRIMLESAGDLIGERRWEEASEMFASAVSFRTSHEDMVMKQMKEIELERGIRQWQYDYFIKEGSLAQYRGFHGEALYQFRKAGRLEATLLVEPDTSLPGLMRRSARPLILAGLSEGRVKAWGYFPEQANAILGKCEQMATEYDIRHDPVITMQIEGLRDDIRQAVCRRAGEQFEAFLASSIREKDLGNYQSALTIAQKAIDAAARAPECGSSDVEAYRLKIELEPLASYEDRLRKVLVLLNVDYDDFIREYRALEIYFREHITSPAVEYVPLEEWAVKNASLGFLRYLAADLNSALQPEKALMLLKRISMLDPNPDKYRTVQQDAGRLLASADVTDSSPNPAACLDEYAAEGIWFRTFRKAYIQEWNRKSGRRLNNLSLLLK
jgi:tetratricopeptide (TPR) repeat protein